MTNGVRYSHMASTYVRTALGSFSQWKYFLLLWFGKGSLFNKAENVCSSNHHFKVSHLGHSTKLFSIYSIPGQFLIHHNSSIQLLLSTDYVQCIGKDPFRYTKMNMKSFLPSRSLVSILRNEICTGYLVHWIFSYNR